jgi:hypothetical protein
MIHSITNGIYSLQIIYFWTQDPLLELPVWNELGNSSHIWSVGKKSISQGFFYALVS